MTSQERRRARKYPAREVEIYIEHVVTLGGASSNSSTQSIDGSPWRPSSAETVEPELYSSAKLTVRCLPDSRSFGSE